MIRLKPERAYWVLLAARSLMMSMIFTANLVYYVTNVGLNPLQLVLVGTTLEVAVLLFEVPTGVVADVYSRRLSIVIGMVLMGLGFTLEGFIPSFAAVIAAQVLWGIGYTFTSGSTEAWIVDETSEEKAASLFLRGSQVSRVFDVIGICLGALLGNFLINVPIVLGGLGMIGLGIFLAFGMPEHNFKPKLNEAGRFDITSGLKASRDTLVAAVKLVRVHPALMTIFGIGLFYGLHSEGFDRLAIAYVLQMVDLPRFWGLAPVVWLAGLSIIESVLAFIATEIIRRRVNTSHARKLTQLLFGLSTVMVGALFGFALSGSFWIAAIMGGAVSVIRQLIMPLYDTWVNQRLDSNVRATVISMSGQVDAVGQIAGGPGVGWIGKVFSIRAALLTSASILTPVLVLYAAALRRGGASGDLKDGGEHAATVYPGLEAK